MHILFFVLYLVLFFFKNFEKELILKKSYLDEIDVHMTLKILIDDYLQGCYYRHGTFTS